MRNISEILSREQLRLSIKEQKKLLRQALIPERKKIKEEVKIQGEAWGRNQFLKAEKILLEQGVSLGNCQILSFYPILSELSFLEFAKPDWLFPFVDGQELLWSYFGDGKFEKNEKGLYEKKDCFSFKPSEKQASVCFVPGLAADQEGYRLGYGGGYYDRFLSKNEVISVLCLPSEFFYFDKLPKEERFDKAINSIIFL